MMAAEAADDELAAAKPPSKTGLKLLDLPAETQQEIVSHVSALPASLASPPSACRNDAAVTD